MQAFVAPPAHLMNLDAVLEQRQRSVAHERLVELLDWWANYTIDVRANSTTSEAESALRWFYFLEQARTAHASCEGVVVHDLIESAPQDLRSTLQEKRARAISNLIELRRMAAVFSGQDDDYELGLAIDISSSGASSGAAEEYEW